ncbi:hypothetical protein ASF61_07155 [Duganella sp. Leaf126]|uniref:sensor histidine kinase n=1 Tax=Duganella sp. Leaf126 TaxID=1736266 RepID=UPI0006FAF1AF|nr:HAMP domain-containing sensor histidine kinase [Duganella sp. Leaf126]KQQ35987.1 hypothetical protein ASF61_07155 [Duganella sp. Leaf126]
MADTRALQPKPAFSRIKYEDCHRAPIPDADHCGAQPQLPGATLISAGTAHWLPDTDRDINQDTKQTNASAAIGDRLRQAAGSPRAGQQPAARLGGHGAMLPQPVGPGDDVDALRRAQQRLRLALDGGKMGTWDIDLRSGVMACSGLCKENYGRSAAAPFTYEDLAASVHPDDVGHWRRAVTDAIESGGEFGIDYRAVWPDGSIHWMYVRGNCDRDDQGRATMLSGISLDVTERRRAQQLEQERAEAALRESQKKSEFLTILAHELRGPLGPVRGALQALKLRGDHPKEREFLRALAERQIDHMVVLIDDLLDLARVERGEIRLRCDAIDLRTPLQLGIEANTALIESRGQHFDVAGIDQPVMVMADPTRVTQMVSNLLNNASKYTPARGRIGLQLTQCDGTVEICVIDNGVGLEASALERIFNMFEQVEDQKAQAQGGLGIGLALTRQLAQLHGGTVTVHSDGIGHGCRFSLALPLMAA